MTDNAEDNLSCFCPVPDQCQMDYDSLDPLRSLKGEAIPCIMTAGKSKNKCRNMAAMACLMRQLKDPDIPFFCRVCDEDSQANIENLKDEQNVDSEAKEVIDLTKVSTSSSQVQSSTSNNATEDPVDFCVCPIPSLCTLTSDDLEILKTSTHSCCKCKNKVYGPCLGEQLDNPMAKFWCRLCDDSTLSFNGSNILQQVRDNILKSSEQIDNDYVNEDSVDSCVCPIPSLCTLTSDNIDILKTSSHSCCKCKNKVYGPCLGEQLHNPMSQFWCRFCDDSTLSFNGLNILQQVQDNILKSSEQIDNDNIMEVVTDDIPELIDNPPENSQNLVANKKKQQQTRLSSTGVGNWSDCVLCFQAQFSHCLNKAGVCVVCLEEQRVSKMQSMMEQSDDSSSSDDGANKIKKEKSLPKKKKETKILKSISEAPVSSPVESSQSSFFNQNSQAQFSGGTENLFNSSGDETNTSVVGANNNTIDSAAAANALLQKHPQMLQFLQSLQIDTNYQLGLDKLSNKDIRQKGPSDSEDTNNEFSDDYNQNNRKQLWPKFEKYSLNMFSPMDNPFKLDINNSSPLLKRSKNVLLASFVFGKQYYDEMDRINKLNVTDKSADGIRYNDMDAIEFAKTYPGLSTCPELLSSKTITFPIRLWSGPRFNSACLTIMSMQITCNSKAACSYHPITCATNAFGEWNGDKNVVKHKSSLSTLWASRHVEEVDYEFSPEALNQCKQLLLSYWDELHGPDPDSHTNLKQTVAQLKERNNQLESEKKDMTKVISTHEKDLKNAQSRIDQLMTKNSSSNSTKQLEKELSIKSKEVIKKEEEIGRLRVEKLTTDIIIKDKDRQIKELEKSKQTICKELEDSSNKNKKAEDQLQVHKSNIQKVEDQLKVQKSVVQTLQKENKALKSSNYEDDDDDDDDDDDMEVGADTRVIGKPSKSKRGSGNSNLNKTKTKKDPGMTAQERQQQLNQEKQRQQQLDEEQKQQQQQQQQQQQVDDIKYKLVIDKLEFLTAAQMAQHRPAMYQNPVSSTLIPPQSFHQQVGSQMLPQQATFQTSVPSNFPQQGTLTGPFQQRVGYQQPSTLIQSTNFQQSDDYQYPQQHQPLQQQGSTRLQPPEFPQQRGGYQHPQQHQPMQQQGSTRLQPTNFQQSDGYQHPQQHQPLQQQGSTRLQPPEFPQQRGGYEHPHQRQPLQQQGSTRLQPTNFQQSDGYQHPEQHQPLQQQGSTRLQPTNFQQSDGYQHPEQHQTLQQQGSTRLQPPEFPQQRGGYQHPQQHPQRGIRDGHNNNGQDYY